jgi:hypothetical protein
MKKIQKIQKIQKKCEINFSDSNQTDNLKKYNILKNFCYLRTYFRYTDETTLNKKFQNTNDKKFNYMKKYNSSYFISMVSYFKPTIIDLKKRNILFKEYTEEQINDAIEILKNKYKKIDSNSDKKISEFLNKRVSREDHYTNIKEVLKILKKNTDNYINYCIILNIKKSNLLSISGISKEKNINIINNNNNNNNNNNRINNNVERLEGNNNNNNQSGGQIIFTGNTKDKKYVEKATFLSTLAFIIMIIQMFLEIAKAMKS